MLSDAAGSTPQCYIDDPIEAYNRKRFRFMQTLVVILVIVQQSGKRCLAKIVCISWRSRRLQRMRV